MARDLVQLGPPPGFLVRLHLIRRQMSGRVQRGTSYSVLSSALACTCLHDLASLNVDRISSSAHTAYRPFMRQVTDVSVLLNPPAAPWESSALRELFTSESFGTFVEARIHRPSGTPAES
jgi:hypothetical protein